jgi:anaerobic magnesium-protoporphyrin IX monomethyl ester cyclase
MVRDCSPDDIGISVSYPLPGTRFFERVKSELGEKQNWDDSDDLALMYRGTYSPEFYRVLHRVVHNEFRMRRAIARVKSLGRTPTRGLAQTVRALLSISANFVRWQWTRAQLNRVEPPRRQEGNFLTSSI